jgi:leader peptidase (prepilin peptidase)/N-methyltransferase
MQDMAYNYFMITVIGAVVGSFLNMLIYRLPRNLGIFLGWSKCPTCRTNIAFYDNIPVVSYFILLGRCRWCKSPISPRYPIVELLNAGCYLLFLYLDGISPAFFAHCYLVSSLIVIFFVDFEFQIIPDMITLPGIAVGLISSIFINPLGIVNSFIGFLVGGVSLLAVAYLGEWIFKKEAMGGGDIKMAAMMGAFVGWQKILLIFLGGALIGLIASIFWMAVSQKVRHKRLIPFGPFLAIAALLTAAAGDQIIQFYIENFLSF